MGDASYPLDHIAPEEEEDEEEEEEEEEDYSIYIYICMYVCIYIYVLIIYEVWGVLFQLEHLLENKTICWITRRLQNYYCAEEHKT